MLTKQTTSIKSANKRQKENMSEEITIFHENIFSLERELQKLHKAKQNEKKIAT